MVEESHYWIGRSPLHGSHRLRCHIAVSSGYLSSLLFTDHGRYCAVCSLDITTNGQRVVSLSDFAQEGALSMAMFSCSRCVSGDAIRDGQTR